MPSYNNNRREQRLGKIALNNHVNVSTIAHLHRVDLLFFVLKTIETKLKTIDGKKRDVQRV